MSDGLDPDDYDITVGTLDHVPTSEEPDDITDGVEITHERFVSLREYISAEYDGDSAPNFALRDIARLEPNQYVVSFCRQRGGAAKWQDEFVALAVWDTDSAAWDLPEVERVVHRSWH